MTAAKLGEIRARLEHVQGTHPRRWTIEEGHSLVRDMWELIRAVEEYREEIALVPEVEQRACANPTCGKLFAPCHRDARYCGGNCSATVRARKRREAERLKRTGSPLPQKVGRPRIVR